MAPAGSRCELPRAGRALPAYDRVQAPAGQVHPHTSNAPEFPSDHGDPYYPIPAPENAALGRTTPDVTLTNRLGTCRYHNMDQVAQSLALFSRVEQEIPVAANDRQPSWLPA